MIQFAVLATRVDTKTVILDAAEGLFAERGFGATSLRTITHQAGVNLAAIHYHFGSKDALVEAVLCRRVDPLNQERLARLDQAERTAGKRPVALETVLDALIRPALRLSCDSVRAGGAFNRILGRLFSEPNPAAQVMANERFQEVFHRFTQALKRALPRLPEKDFFWRLHFTVGAMGLAMCDRERPRRISNGVCDPDNFDEVARELVAFAAAGMRASRVKNTGAKRA